jgi:hypothetical protein
MEIGGIKKEAIHKSLSLEPRWEVGSHLVEERFLSHGS